MIKGDRLAALFVLSLAVVSEGVFTASPESPSGADLLHLIPLYLLASLTFATSSLNFLETASLLFNILLNTIALSDVEWRELTKYAESSFVILSRFLKL